MIDKGVCDKGFIWTPTNCECECDKSRDIGEYVDYENCKCKKRLVDKLVEECTETVEGVKLAKITSMQLHAAKIKNKHQCSSFTLCVVLFSILFIINFGIDIYFCLFSVELKKRCYSC